MAGKHLLDAAQQLSMHRTEIEAAWRKRNECIALFSCLAGHKATERIARRDQLSAQASGGRDGR